MAKNKKIIREDTSRMEETNVVRSGFHVGDALLVLLALLIVAVLIFTASVIVPAVRDNFREYEEDLTFVVEFPFTESDTVTPPGVGDLWVLLDSEDAVCTVRNVAYSAEGGYCRVTLLRKATTYREGDGYMIEGTRISVGSTIYFRRDPEHYFAALVTGISSDRFPIPETTASDEATQEVENDG